MNSITVCVIGPYKSGKTTLVGKLQQRKGMEGDVSFYFLRYNGKDITLLDTPGDMDTPALIASSLSVSNAVLFCISPDTGINFQVGELLILTDTFGIDKGIICLTKTDMVAKEEIESLRGKILSLIKGTSLEHLDIMEVNMNDDQKIADIRAKLSEIPYESDRLNRPAKVTIDHAFESRGMSIAVGTLVNGKVSIHDDLMITPTPFTKEISVNSLQINQEEVQTAEAGDRVGIGIKGVWPWDLPRGVELRAKGSYRDVKEGKMKISINKLYKYEIKEASNLTMICNWQEISIKLQNLNKQGDQIIADFSAEKNFVFDSSDKLLLINKDLPIRVLRIVGKAEVI
ncbi:MAG: GTP-binding protein [Nanoarchaeota archaeon]|nr:GTP-binding protein [Nanoarchaeota archaeon]